MPRFIDFDELYKGLADSPATVKLLLVDACRNELLAQPEGRPGGIEMPAPPPPPASVAALFSCSEKEVSWEDSELDGGHGVFFHYVIQGLSGKADEERGNHNHKVELDELYSYVKDNVVAFVAHKHFTAQRPRLLGDLGPVDLLDVSTRSSDRELVSTKVGQIKLKRIPSGMFLMGSPDGTGEEDEHRQHEVRITQPFYLGVTEVTQAQYEAVMGNNPSWFAATGGGKDKVAGQSTGELPVEHVSWLDAVKFCNRLSEMEGRKPFYEINGETVRVPDWKASGYRLPTEAEWEYACRAGTASRYSFGDDPADLGEHEWFSENSGSRTHPVGEKRPNAFGLFDMAGNVLEWCWDAYDKDYYTRSPRDNPTGPDAAGAAFRVFRGGGWGYDPRSCRSAVRDEGTPGLRDFTLGFRLALVQ